MKRRSARQLVRLLSDIRHASHCTALRAAATNRAMALASAESAEHDAETASRDEGGDSADNADATRDAQHDKPARSRS